MVDFLELMWNNKNEVQKEIVEIKKDVVIVKNAIFTIEKVKVQLVGKSGKTTFYIAKDINGTELSKIQVPSSYSISKVKKDFENIGYNTTLLI